MNSKHLMTQSRKSQRNLESSQNIASRRPLPGDGKTWTLEMAVPRSRFRTNPQVFTINQTVTTQAYFNTVIATPSFAALSFTLGDLPQYTTLTSLFDQYRFEEVEFWLAPQVSSAPSGTSGQLFTVVDYDDATALTTVNQANEYTTCVTGPLKNGHYRRIVPRMAVAAFAIGVFTSFTNVGPQWIDAASPSVQHYGIKIACSPTPGGVVTFDLTLRYKVSFLSVR